MVALYTEGETEMEKLKNFLKIHWPTIVMVVAILLLTFVFPDDGYAAKTTKEVKQKVNDGVKAISGVITGAAVLVGILAAGKVAVGHLPQYDDPHIKQEMWKSMFGILKVVAAVSAFAWVVPWIWAIFK